MKRSAIHHKPTIWRAQPPASRSRITHRAQRAPSRGRSVCRFTPLDASVNMGVQYYSASSTLCVFIGVTASAAQKQRRRYKELADSHIPELENEIGQKLDWSDPFFSVEISADIKNTGDWPRQHQWVLETTKKFVNTFKSRLEIE